MSSYAINRVVLVGRLTRDPELRALPSGTNVCSLRLACNESRRGSDGDYHDRANYFDISVYGARADVVDRFLRKGRRVAIDGRLEWREWEAADQTKRQAVSVVAETVQFLDAPDARQDGGEGWHRETGGDGGEEGAGERELVGVGAGGEEDLAF